VYRKDRDTFNGKANELLEAIRIERNEVESRLILLLGYSMGRLLIKQALINAHNNPKYTCYDIPLFKGSVAGLPLICTEGGAPGYKSTGRSRIQDRIIIINSINSNLMSKCSACLILTTHRSKTRPQGSHSSPHCTMEGIGC
jgi:hypothetical protein